MKNETMGDKTLGVWGGEFLSVSETRKEKRLVQRTNKKMGKDRITYVDKSTTHE